MTKNNEIVRLFVRLFVVLHLRTGIEAGGRKTETLTTVATVSLIGGAGRGVEEVQVEVEAEVVPTNTMVGVEVVVVAVAVAISQGDASIRG